MQESPIAKRRSRCGILFGLLGVFWLAFFLITHYRNGEFGFAWVLLHPQHYWTADWQRHLWQTLPGVLLPAAGAVLFAKSLRLRLGFFLLAFLGATLLPEFWCGWQDLQFRSKVRADVASARSEDRWWPNPEGYRLYFKPRHPIQARNTPTPR